MSKSLVWMIVALVVVIGGAVWLAGRDATRPLTHVEKLVPDNALGH